MYLQNCRPPSLLAQLNDEVNEINDLIQRIHEQRYQLYRTYNTRFFGPNDYDYEPTIWRAVAALQHADKIKKITVPMKNPTNLPNDDSLEVKYSLIPSLKNKSKNKKQSGRRNLPVPGDMFNDDFYQALATVFKKDIKLRPDLQKNLGLDFDPLILMNPRAQEKNIPPKSYN